MTYDEDDVAPNTPPVQLKYCARYSVKINAARPGGVDHYFDERDFSASSDKEAISRARSLANTVAEAAKDKDYQNKPGVVTLSSLVCIKDIPLTPEQREPLTKVHSALDLNLD